MIGVVFDEEREKFEDQTLQLYRAVVILLWSIAGCVGQKRTWSKKIYILETNNILSDNFSLPETGALQVCQSTNHCEVIRTKPGRSFQRSNTMCVNVMHSLMLNKKPTRKFTTWPKQLMISIVNLKMFGPKFQL